MKSIFYVVLFLSSVTCIAAGRPDPIKKAVKPEVSRTVKQKKLAVLMYSVDAEEERKLKPQEIVEYRKNIESMNVDLKKVVTTFWTLHSDVSFLTVSEMAALPAFKADYVILAVSTINISAGIQLGRYPTNQVARLHLCFPDSYDPIRPIFYMDMPALNKVRRGVPPVERVDMAAALLMVQNHLSGVAEGKKLRADNSGELTETSGQLATKTLLIDKRYLDEDVTEEEAKKAYPGRMEICDMDRIEQILFAKNPQYAFVFFIPDTSTQPYFAQYVLSSDAGHVLSIGIVTTIRPNNLIDERYLQKYWEYGNYFVNKQKK